MFGFFKKAATAPASTSSDSAHQIIKDLEEIIIRLQTAINSLKLGFIIVDANLEVVNINESARALLCSEYGKPAANHVCTVNELNEHIKVAVRLEEAIKTCLSTRTAVFLKDIELGGMYIYIRIYPILLGGFKEPAKNVLTGASIIIEDVTQEKITLRSRDEFLSIASHELRTPLTAVRGNASLIKEYYRGLLSEHKDLAEMIDDIESAGVHLIRIVNEFLNVSRLEQGKLIFNRELFNLYPLIEAVMNDVKFTAQEKNLNVTFENLLSPADTLYILADEVRTREVLVNILENAIKYTEKGFIKLNLSRSADKVIIKVIDSGRGIPLHNQSMLFRKFQQAGNSIYTRDSSSGTGLGLYISRQLSEKMGGSLYLESSEENKGSTFVFTLPVASELEIRMLQSGKLNGQEKNKANILA